MADALSQGESRTPIDVQRLARILAVLADPTRLRMIRLVAKRELSGIDIAEALGISQALACHHLAKLVDCGLIQRRREGVVKFGILDPRLLEQYLDQVRTLTGG